MQRKGAAATAAATKRDQRGVVVLSRIPFGFFEAPMRNFFKQFGTVTRLRLARNPKVHARTSLTVGLALFADTHTRSWRSVC